MAIFTENAEFRAVLIVHDFRPQNPFLTDAHVLADANIDATKLQHDHRGMFAQESGTTAAAEERVVHVVKGATGTVKKVAAGAVVANIGAATCTIDVHKNGATIMSATFDLTSGEAAYELVVGTIDPAKEAVVAGDVIEVILTVAAGGGTLATGVFCYVDVFEEAD